MMLATGIFENASAEVGHDQSKIKVISADKYFSTDAIKDLLDKKLSPGSRNRLTTGPDAFWAYTEHSLLKGQNNYCFAIVGLTENPTSGKSARVPEKLYTNWVRHNSKGPLNDSLITECRSAALNGAVDEFANAPLKEQLTGIERTRENGIRDKTTPASRSSVYVVSSGLSPENRKLLLLSVPDEFRAAFDYRKLSIYVETEGVRFPTTESDAGNLEVCAALVGASARPPENRNCRFPGSWNFVFVQLDPKESSLKSADQNCRLEASRKALADAMSDSWDRKGLLAGIETTQEDGVELPADYFRNPKNAGAANANHSP